MENENKDLVTEQPADSFDALVDNMVDRAMGPQVTAEKNEGQPAEAKTASEPQESAPEGSPDDRAKALEAKLAEMEKKLSASQSKMFEALSELNRVRKSPKAEGGSDASDPDDESDESDTAVGKLYKKHFKALSDKHPDWDDAKVRQKASSKAWEEHIESKVVEKAKALVNDSPVVRAHEDSEMKANQLSASEFVSSKPELKDPNSEVHKLTDRLFTNKLVVLGAANGAKYVEVTDDGKVTVLPAAYKDLNMKDLIEASYYETLGRFGGQVQKSQPKKPEVPRAQNGRFQPTNKKFETSDDFFDSMADFL